MRFRIALSLVASSGVLMVASNAFAQSLEVDVRPGYGSSGSKSPVTYVPTNGASLASPDSIFSGTTTPYGGGFVGDASVGLKLMPFVSFGLAGQYRTMSATAPANSDVSGITRSSVGAGFYAHVYIPIPLFPLEPWAGIGAQYLHDKQSYTQTGNPFATEITHYGVAIPLTVGVAYPFLHFLAIGPSFTFQPVIGASACIAGGASSYCTNSSPGQDFVHKASYQTWTLGLDVRLQVP
jgi:hypothetical protein